MSDTPIRILIVDDHALVREGIRQALTVPGFTVVGEAGNEVLTAMADWPTLPIIVNGQALARPAILEME